MMVLIALVLGFGCTALWYLCSTQQRLRSNALSAPWRVLAWLLAVGSLAAWIEAAGTGAGIAAALTTWMLGCVVLPYMAWWRQVKAEQSP
ncbi:MULTISPECIES: hypothetical protein [Dyella]|uniref:DUF3325 domain-containing protein n=2 Tax=Dyella TaxID=231454 RepID=A0A4R0YTX6_9GAMM|nr:MULTISPECIES: hypothetical protein [Dyella]TBR39696.1 hypothetical protein EYV96_05760 [Dyella terrae]TCI12722.1 hypothetical protein EZM97_05110 [Dyella soli]